MNRNRSLWCAAVVMFVLAAPCLWSQSDQPSLADVARQKSAAKAKRVVTNDEIPPSPEANLAPAPGPTAAGGSGKAGAAPAAKKEAAKPDVPADKQSRMQELTKDHEDLLKVIKQLQDKLAANTDTSLADTLNPVLQHAKDALAKNEAEMDKLKAGGAAASPPGASQPTNAPPAPAK
jgi:hypothetical protein